MDIREEIAKQVEKLPHQMQEQVLRFAASLVAPPAGERGTALLPFSSSLDSESARQMTQAIEEECERVDAAQW
jgi:hypothetical protein